MCAIGHASKCHPMCVGAIMFFIISSSRVCLQGHHIFKLTASDKGIIILLRVSMKLASYRASSNVIIIFKVGFVKIFKVLGYAPPLSTNNLGHHKPCHHLGAIMPPCKWLQGLPHALGPSMSNNL